MAFIVVLCSCVCSRTTFVERHQELKEGDTKQSETDGEDNSKATDVALSRRRK